MPQHARILKYIMSQKYPCCFGVFKQAAEIKGEIVRPMF